MERTGPFTPWIVSNEPMPVTHNGAGPAAQALLSGAVDSAALPRLAEHFAGCFSPAPGPITLEVAIRDAARLLANEAEQLTRLRYGTR